MPERSWQFRLEDMLLCTRNILDYTNGISKEEFMAERKAIEAVLYNLVIIGEAASRISEQDQSGVSEVPWNSIRGMRNRLIHDYPGMDLEIVWQTVQEDIPALKSILSEVVARLQR
jgi:uncharacterized protein with HEPN domain